MVDLVASVVSWVVDSVVFNVVVVDVSGCVVLLVE